MAIFGTTHGVENGIQTDAKPSSATDRVAGRGDGNRQNAWNRANHRSAKVENNKAHTRAARLAQLAIATGRKGQALDVLTDGRLHIVWPEIEGAL